MSGNISWKRLMSERGCASSAATTLWPRSAQRSNWGAKYVWSQHHPCTKSIGGSPPAVSPSRRNDCILSLPPVRHVSASACQLLAFAQSAYLAAECAIRSRSIALQFALEPTSQVVYRTHTTLASTGWTASAPDAWAYAFHCGAEVVGSDRESRELVGGYPLLEIAEVYGATHANKGGLATEGFQVGARVASGEARYQIQVEVGVRGHLASVDPEYVKPRFGVGKSDLDLVVEAARTPEGWVERTWSIGGGYDADSAQIVEPVHEG